MDARICWPQKEDKFEHVDIRYSEADLRRTARFPVLTVNKDFMFQIL